MFESVEFIFDLETYFLPKEYGKVKPKERNVVFTSFFTYEYAYLKMP